MFGIQKLIVKLAIIGAVAITIICVMTTVGCASVNGALAQKNMSETTDESLTVNAGDSLVLDPLEIIQAKADAKVGLVRAQEEKWRILVWVVGLGAIVLSALALLVRSPFDRRVGVAYEQ